MVTAEQAPVATTCVWMVAWCMEMSTLKFPGGRTILVVGNDVTHNAGSFCIREDAFFSFVIDHACQNKFPLIYLAAKSSARIGVAVEVKDCFKVGWFDELSLNCGFQYLYPTLKDYKIIGLSIIAHEIKLESSEIRWIRCGAIASAYLRAYQETFTLAYVTGKIVGIGVYLARLRMCFIHRLDRPIIFTRYSALNKLLGWEVHSSHMQLGGPKIMAPNGVVDLTISNYLEGVLAILNWLSYIPPYIGGPLPFEASRSSR